MITDNNLLDDNRPYHYQRNTPVQQDLLINFDNNDTDNETNNEDLLQQQEVNNYNIPQQQHGNENDNEDDQLNASQAGTSTNAGKSTNAGHRQIPDLSEFQLEVSVQDKIRLVLNLI